MSNTFWKYVNKTGECWLWTAGKHASGYGATTVKNRSVRAHRYAYELACGPIPDGWDIHHHCGNKACVRPSHLRQIPHNLHPTLHRKKATHCRHGHPFDEANTYVTKRGIRQCRTCNRERKAAAYRLLVALKPTEGMRSFVA